MLNYLDQRYGKPEIWILENGISEKGEAKRTGAARTEDPLRTKVRGGTAAAVVPLKCHSNACAGLVPSAARGQRTLA